MVLSFGKSALCAQFVILGAHGRPVAPATGNLTSQLIEMCPGSYPEDPQSNWAWSTGVSTCPSCTNPPTQNWGKMCPGDPTSVVIENYGKPSCLRTAMTDCKMNMHEVQQIDFDLRLSLCGSTWAAPLWLTPDYWAGGGASGELDLVELCPAGDVWTNFAGAEAPIGYQSKWEFADPNYFIGHVTMWKNEDGGKGGVTAKMCDETERDNHGGHCSGKNAAYYPSVYGSNGCSSSHDCMFTMVSDIWNGYSGDGGFYACSAGYPQTDTCRTSVRNIRIKGPQFYGKCAALNAWTDEVV